MDFDDSSSSDERNILASQFQLSGDNPPSPTEDARNLMPSENSNISTSTQQAMVGLSNNHNVNLLAFEDDGKDASDDDVGIARHEPQRAESSVGGERLHHQLVEAAGDGGRPLARHGCTFSLNSGRLGDTTDDANTQRRSVEGDEQEEFGTIDGEASIEDSKEWESVLDSMIAVDMTPMSRFYVGRGRSWDTDLVEVGELAYDTEAMVKTISLFFINPARGEQDEVVETNLMVFETLQRLASHMRSMQSILTEAGLTVESQIQQQQQGREEQDLAFDKSEMNPKNVVCRGVYSVHVDSMCRLIGVIDVDTCVVSLSDVIAFSSQPFSEHEIVAILKSVIKKVSLLHAAGIVHGCLHGGNVLCSTDDGHTTLTGVSGIMSNPLFPTDPSFISPRLAAALQPLVKLMWAHKEEADEDTFSWAADPLLHQAVLERYGCTAETPMRAQLDDDVYAIGILALSCFLGVPPFHSATLKEVVDVLASHYTDRRNACLVGDAFTSSYAVQRFRLAGYSEEFLVLAKDLVVMCLDAGSTFPTGPRIAAGDVLMHPFFTKHPIGSYTNQETEAESDHVVDDMEEAMLIDRTVHCLVYPIFSVLEGVQKNCRDYQLMPRLYRNSIFAARWNTLQSGMSHHDEGDSKCGVDTVSLLWPYLENSHAPCGGDCSDNSRNDRLVSDSQKETASKSFLYRSWITTCPLFSQKTVDNGRAALSVVAKAKGMQIDYEARTLFFSGKSNDRLVLHNDEIPIEFRSSVDTLVLQGLKECVVEVNMGFRYVFVRDVALCKVSLGPCYFFYCDEIVDCNPLAVACAHMCVGNISRAQLCCSSCTEPVCRDGCFVSNVSIAPYNVAYAGITEDFAAMSLPQELDSLMLSVKSVFDSEKFSLQKVKLHNMLRGGFEYPYAHALVAFGNCFVHENDDIGDVFLFFSEVAGKDVRIARVNGRCDSTAKDALSLFSQNSSYLPLWHSRHTIGVDSQNKEADDAGSGSPSLPIIFILDVVGDCVIEDCSFCTIFLVGSSDTVSVRRCSQLRLFLMAKEALFEDCDRMEVHLLVTESLLAEHSSHVEFFPLALEAPHLEEILSAIVHSCGDEQLCPLLEDALRQKDVGTLNVLLREEGDSNAVDVVECHNVRLHNTSERMFLVDFASTEAAASRFFYEAHHKTRRVEDWTPIPFMRYALDHTRRELPICSSALLPPVRLHDLVNVSILRLPGTLNLRATVDQSLPLVDVVLERILFGEVHLTEALGTLFIRRCTGPLNIVVCAVSRVVMESCEHVTLQTACGSFIARDCHSCHVALHVNTPPRYESCTGMQSSTLNITSEEFESCLERAGVGPDVNLFDKPQVEPSATNGDALFFDTVSDIGSVDSLAKALSVLHKPVTFVPPLPATCLGIKDASFPGFLEDRVIYEEKTRQGFHRSITAALSFLSLWVTERETATDDILKSPTHAADDEGDQLRFSCSPKLDAPPPPEPTRERHVDPLVDCSNDDMRGLLCTTREESSACVSQLMGDGVCPQLHTDSSSNGGGRASSRGSGVYRDKNTTSSCDYVAPVHHSENPAAGQTGSEKCGEIMPMGRQDSTDATPLGSRLSLPQDNTSRELSSAGTPAAALGVASLSVTPKKTSLANESNSGGQASAVEGTRRCVGEQPLHALFPSDNTGNDVFRRVMSESHLSSTQSLETQTKNNALGTLQEMTNGGGFSFADLIVDVHPEDEAAVRSALCNVEVKREAMLLLRREGNSSLKEIEQRAWRALKRLRKLSE